jgi:hypothetical protein
MRISALLVALLLPLTVFGTDTDAKAKPAKPDTTKSKAQAKKSQSGWCEEDCGKGLKADQAKEKSQPQKQQTRK